ncbi:WSC domain-containing protein [Aspergillus ambiguus]|uniref:WSC domain-containing protein n=1 Tax=Aspergillus ambiguus TaxID=176160 RepID=UPI003CCCC8A7
MFSAIFLTTSLALVSASPGTLIHPLIARQSVSLDGLCGAYNGTATCAGSGFGNCCSQFGYCGSSPAYCGTGCQAGYGVCGVDTTLRWASLGCYSDDTNARTLNTSILVHGNTVEACQAACAGEGYTYAGMEYGTQCFCGTAIGDRSTLVDAGCDTPCPANPSEICGGSNSLSLYAIVPVWQSIGCYSDSTKARTLSMSYNIAGNTVAKCQTACKMGGYIYAGMEYGTQCFCGNTIDNEGAPATGCATPCAGDSSEICGGSNVLSMYYLFQ